MKSLKDVIEWLIKSYFPSKTGLGILKSFFLLIVSLFVVSFLVSFLNSVATSSTYFLKELSMSS